MSADILDALRVIAARQERSVSYLLEKAAGQIVKRSKEKRGKPSK